jgi:DNA-binding Xre family transcriptional regulator
MISFEPLKRLLKERKITTTFLEKKCGISNLSIIMLGQLCPRTDVIENICKILDCDIDDIIRWEDKDRDKKTMKVQYVDVNWNTLCELVTNNKTSLGKLSQSLGRSYAFLSNAKQKGSKLRATELDDICKTLNCNKEDLLVY